MIEFINKFTGTRMWVAEQRKDEYMAAGHKLAADICVATNVVEDTEPKPVKKTTKRATKTKTKK